MIRSLPTLAGVDGCRGGWVAVVQEPGRRPEATVFPSFVELVGALAADAIIAVDMPIGFPDHAGQGGRGPEGLARRHLGERQSSVFSMPSRAAVYAEDVASTPLDRWYDAHRRASAVARATSTPPRAISIQAFALFPKIREIDALLRARPGLSSRVLESHPEVAFWRLNGERPMANPKKVKGAVNPAGLAERRDLMAGHGIARDVLERPPPPGAGADDFLDAVAMLLVAERFARGEAVPFPDPPGRDGHGLPIAIWS